MKIKNNFLWITLEKISGVLTSFFLFLYLASLLSPKEYGQVIFFSSIIMISFRFSDFGFINDLIKEKNNQVNKNFNYYFYSDTFANGIILLILTITAFFFVSFNEFILFFIICLTTYMNNISSNFKSFAQKKFNFKFLCLIAIFYNFSLLSIAFILSKFDVSIYLLVIPSLIVQSLLILFLIIYFKKFIILKPNFIKKLKKTSLKKRINYLCYGIAEEVFLRIDNILVYNYFGKASLDIYEKTYQYGNIINSFIGDIFYKFLLPYFGSSEVKNKLNDLIKVSKVGFYLYPLFSIIFYYFFIFIVKNFLNNEWYQIVIYLKYILIFSVLYGIYQNFKSFILTNVKISSFTKLEIFRLLVFIILIFVFFDMYGFVGIFLALTLTMIFSLILMFYIIYKSTKTNILIYLTYPLVSFILSFILFFNESLVLKLFIPISIFLFLLKEMSMIKNNKSV